MSSLPPLMRHPRVQAHLLGSLLFGLMAGLLALVVAGAMLFAGAF